MIDVNDKLVMEISNFLKDYFKNRNYFACIYGSYVNGKKNKDSDIDVIIATNAYTKSDVKNLKTFILKLHEVNGLKIDNEVPFENKLLITYSDFKDAVKLDAFPKVKGKYTVPRVVKSNKFLSSHNVKLRLAFNAITSPHAAFGSDLKHYKSLRKKAEENLIKFVTNRLEGSNVSKEDVLNALLYGENKESGEMYLGYKDYPKVRAHLNAIISKYLVSKKDRILVAVAWPYVNGNLHIGHVAGYLLPADITSRFFRLIGQEVLMVSGSDCFGTPITVEADKKGISPKEVVTIYHKRNLKLFSDLQFSFDLYTKTDTRNHREITKKFLEAFWDKGLLEVKTQQQYYSPKANKFLPDRYVEGECPNCGYKESRSDQCDNCGSLLDQNLINPISKVDKSDVILKETEHLFILWEKLQEDVEKYVSDKSPLWRDWVRKEAKNWLKKGLKPRAVTRDLDWGVNLPAKISKGFKNSDTKRIYVWFDAVIGYYSASIEWAKKHKKDWKQYWYGDDIRHYYFMGKDNLVFHTIFWPGQLMTYDNKLHLPDYPAINQYLNLEGAKFSKSRGVVIDTAEFVERYGPDALRFYLTTIMPENSDTSFSWEDFYEKNNNLLVGHLGNYIHRTLSLYKGEKIGKFVSRKVVKKSENALSNSIKYLKKSEFKNYLLEIESLSKYANQYFNECRPWITKKENKEKFIADSADLLTLSYVIACLLEPITPLATDKYLKITNLVKNELWKNNNKLSRHLNGVMASIKINNPVPLYKKFEPQVKQNG